MNLNSFAFKPSIVLILRRVQFLVNHKFLFLIKGKKKAGGHPDVEPPSKLAPKEAAGMFVNLCGCTVEEMTFLGTVIFKHSKYAQLATSVMLLSRYFEKITKKRSYLLTTDGNKYGPEGFKHESDLSWAIALSNEILAIKQDVDKNLPEKFFTLITPLAAIKNRVSALMVYCFNRLEIFLQE